MKTIKLFIFSLLTLLIGATGCIHDTIEGNGVRATEGRTALNFDKVKSSGAFDVHITKGNDYELIVSAEENIMPAIETSVSNGILNLDIRNNTNIRSDLPIEIFITTPELEGVKLSGSGKITTDYFECQQMDINLSGSGTISTACDADKVNVAISGSGSVEISGKANKTELNISGSGNIEASYLNSEACYSKISGSGDVWISVDKYLRASISGSGNVFYYGQPELNKNISGSGKVISQH